MKCTSCGAIVSTKITTCDFCGVTIQKIKEELIVEVPQASLIQEQAAEVDSGSLAMFEALDNLGAFFGYLDAIAYDPSEEHSYHVASQLTTGLHDVIVAQFPDWDEAQMIGILLEDPDSIVRKDGLVMTFDGDATVVFSHGLGSVKIENNLITGTGYQWWDNSDEQALGFWFNASESFVNFGNPKAKTYFYGASWGVFDDEIDYDQLVLNANSWIDRIQNIALGNIAGDNLVDPKYLDQNDLVDGSKWIGAIDVNGMITGYGVQKFLNGDVYEGYCLNGSRHGQGKYSWRNGEVYEGGWANGLRHGQGVDVFADGTSLEGEWINGVYQE